METHIHQDLCYENEQLVSVELTGVMKISRENLKTLKMGDLKGEKVDDTTLAEQDMKQQEKIISNLKSEIENKEKQLKERSDEIKRKDKEIFELKIKLECAISQCKWHEQDYICFKKRYYTLCMPRIDIRPTAE